MPPKSMSDALQAARRIVAAAQAVERAKEETHPSFTAAVRNLAYQELSAAIHDGSLAVARALLAKPTSDHRLEDHLPQ